MLDNLRDQDPSLFDQQEYTDEEVNHDSGLKNIKKYRTNRKFLGLSPLQIFILQLLTLMVVCLLGTMFLIVTGKIVPPFL